MPPPGIFRRLANFFLFTSFFIAGCAVLMTAHALYLYGLPVHRTLLLFVACGTLCSYNFHWMLTPALYGESIKAAWSFRNRNLHAVLFALSSIGSAYCVWKLRVHWPWLLLTAFITFLYSAPKLPLKPFTWLRKIAVGKTAFLALAWTHIPYILPLLMSGKAWTIIDYGVVFNRFYLIYPICILFDYRDRAADKNEGIRSLVTYLPEDGVRRLFIGSLVVFFTSCVALACLGLDGFELVLLTLPGFILAFLYRHALRPNTDYFYYFALDGLMALSAAFSLIRAFPTFVF
jgi:hypothetical protein